MTGNLKLLVISRDMCVISICKVLNSVVNSIGRQCGQFWRVTFQNYHTLRLY